MAGEFSEFVASVVKRAEKFAKERAIGYAQSSRVRKSIRGNSRQQGQATYIITVSAHGTPKVPRLAYYREFGTEAHPINPRNHPVLVFPWEKAYDYIPRTKDGRVILKKVNHPGSKADNEGRGYLRPAGRDTVKFIKSELKGKVAASVRAEIVGSFRTK